MEATWEFIDYWLERTNPDLLWAIENPMGKLRKLPVMERAPYRTSITYCAYGDTRRKPIDIWTNFPWAARPMCANGDPCHVAAPRGSRTPGSTQGHKTVDRSRLPERLCLEIIDETEMTAAHGPSRMLINVAPVTWAVVPPGRGMVKIITTKLNADDMARKGTCGALSSSFTLLDA